LLRVCLNRVLNRYVGLVCAWYVPLDQQNVVFQVNLNNLQVLHRPSVVTHPTWQLLTLEDVVDDRTQGTRTPVVTGTVCHRPTPLTIFVNVTLVTMTLSDTRNADRFAFCEYVRLDFVTNFDVVS